MQNKDYIFIVNDGILSNVYHRKSNKVCMHPWHKCINQVGNKVQLCPAYTKLTQSRILELTYLKLIGLNSETIDNWKVLPTKPLQDSKPQCVIKTVSSPKSWGSMWSMDIIVKQIFV